MFCTSITQKSDAALSGQLRSLSPANSFRNLFVDCLASFLARDSMYASGDPV